MTVGVYICIATVVTMSLVPAAGSDTNVLSRHRRATEFRRMWVTQCGEFTDKPTGASLEVAATVAVSDLALQKVGGHCYVFTCTTVWPIRPVGIVKSGGNGSYPERGEGFGFFYMLKYNFLYSGGTPVCTYRRVWESTYTISRIRHFQQ